MATAMALLCELPHSGTHRLWFDHKSMLSLPRNATYFPSSKSGSSPCRKGVLSVEAKSLFKLCKQFPVASGGPKGVPSSLARK